MKIALNSLSAQAGGGISAFINLMPALARVDRKNEFIVFISKDQEEILEIIPDGFRKVFINYLPKNPYVRTAWEQFALPFYLLFYRADILYSVGNITTLLAPCKIVLLIENANPFSNLKIKWTLKESFRIKLLWYLGRFSAKRANKIRFLSENSKKLLVKQLNLPEDKCVTIYHGCDDLSQKLEDRGKKFKPEQSYILSVAVVFPHKNLENLIRAYDILVRNYHYRGNLVIVGDLFYRDYVEKLNALISELKLCDKVVLKGKVLHKNIGLYYANADVFVLPSIEETFGIPVVEAMRHGVPLAVSDGTLPSLKDCFIPFREICGDAASYFDPFDPADIARKVHALISDAEYRKRILRAGEEQVSKYKWDQTAEALTGVFEEIHH